MQVMLPSASPVAVQDLRYFVDAPSKAKSDNSSKAKPDKLELLKGITGYAAPGVLTALMGGSGMLLSLVFPGHLFVFLDGQQFGLVLGAIGIAVLKTLTSLLHGSGIFHGLLVLCCD